MENFCVGDAFKAKTLIEQLIKLGCKLDGAIIAPLISLYGKQKKPEEAHEVFLAFADSPASEKLFNSVLDAFVKCGKPEEAYFLYKQGIQKGLGLGAVAISIIVNALANGGMTDNLTNVQITQVAKLMCLSN